MHFAEQRAAPYSMKNSKAKRYTIDNNVSGSNNLCCAIIDSELDIHIVHLGTMGVYGYGTSGGEIPEGYIDVILPGGREANILHPAHPGSVYHATKCLDALLWQFYQKNDDLRITDLHQGIVWGTNTPQTIKDERLINRFDYEVKACIACIQNLMAGVRIMVEIGNENRDEAKENKAAKEESSS